MHHRLASRLLAACWAAVLFGLALTTPAGGVVDARPRLFPATTSLMLLSQQPWVSATSGLRLSLAVDSPLPTSRLGLKVVLYSEVHTRDAFQQTLSGTEPQSEVPIDLEPSGGTIPLAAVDRGGRVDLALPVRTDGPGGGSPRSPALSLHCSGYCPGVYPLELVLFDDVLGSQLASLTTYLVYSPPQTGALKLDVALVLPVGFRPALAPSGMPALSARRLSELAALGSELDHQAPGTLSVDVYAQVLVALARDRSPRATVVLARLARALGGAAPPQELLRAPFAQVDPSALWAAKLGTELGPQLGVARRVESATLKATPSSDLFVAQQPQNPAALSLLASQGIHELVVPPSSLTVVLPAGTTVSPYRLEEASPAGPGLVFVSDPSLAAPFSASNGDPALAAQQFLAELAVVYFEYPFLSSPRAVVVTPPTAGPGSRFLDPVLAGLADSPIVQPTTLGSLLELFSGDRSLATTRLVSFRASGAPPGRLVLAARRSLQTLESVVPESRALTTGATESILLGESAGIGARQSRAFERAPAAALGSIGRSLSLLGSRTVTLTARTGRVPVTVSSQFPGVIHLVMKVRSSDLTFPGGDRFPLRLSPRAGTSTSVTVRSVTSGVTTLQVTLISPVGTRVLAAEQFSIRSTAISGVAIALSIGALLVLAIWWARSWRRHRRRGARSGRASAGGAVAAP